MKLIIQIPCFNEEKTLPLVLERMPKVISGISEIEIVVINDGSNDKTAEIARKYGATIINHAQNLGLGMAFKHGLEYALEQKADILVNLDGDNQYPSHYIPALLQPILAQKADVVIGNRVPWKIKHFSFGKRFFHYFGNFLVRKLIRTNIPDTVSGFRAYNQEALYSLNITTKFSYVLDTLMQLSQKGFRAATIPININPPTRESRLYKNIFQYMFRSGLNILRLYLIYKPFKSFFFLALSFFIPGFLFGLRFLIFLLRDQGQGHIQSLIATAILILTSVILLALGFIAELLKVNRQLIEEQLNRLKKEKHNGAKQKQDHNW